MFLLKKLEIKNKIDIVDRKSKVEYEMRSGTATVEGIIDFSQQLALQTTLLHIGQVWRQLLYSRSVQTLDVYGYLSVVCKAILKLSFMISTLRN